MQGGGERRRRFHLLVRKDLQLKSLRVVGAALLGMMGLVACVAYGIVACALRRLPPPSGAGDWFVQVSSTVHLYLFWGGVGCIAVAAVVALMVSHQIAAPLVRIETELKQALRGAEGLSPIHVRETDALKEFSEELNRLMAEWRQQKGEGKGPKERSN